MLSRFCLYLFISCIASTKLTLPSVAQTKVPSASYAPVHDKLISHLDVYFLDEGDVLYVELLDEYEGEYGVSIDGTLSLPLIGDVNVSGKSLDSVIQVLNTAYKKYLKYPRLSVRLQTARSVEIAVFGEVTSPGTYILSPTQENPVPQLTEALQVAGGLMDTADFRNVEIQRDGHIISVNLWEIVNNGRIEHDRLLRDGDVVFIPPVQTLNSLEVQKMDDASFAARQNGPIEVAVVGEVRRPGKHTLEDDESIDDSEAVDQDPATVTDALTAAGGITEVSDIRRIKLKRLTRSGDELIVDIDLWTMLQSGDFSQDLALESGDTIIVPKAEEIDIVESRTLATASFAADTVPINVVGEVNQPGIVEVQPNSPLNQVLLAAGGFTRNANTEEVILVSLNPDGTANEKEIILDFTKGPGHENNPILTRNDVIIVSESGFSQVTRGLGSVGLPILPFVRIFDLIF